MKKIGPIILSALLFIFLIAAIASAVELKDPYYKQWASFKVGSNVSLVGRSEDTAGIESFTQKMTPKEIGNDYLVV